MRTTILAIVVLTLCSCRDSGERPAAQRSEGETKLVKVATAPALPVKEWDPRLVMGVPPSDLPIRRNPTHPGTHPKPDSLYQRPYIFTVDWFTGSLPVFETFFGPYKSRENLRYLEIGVYEGRSLIWMLENVLTAPSAHVTAVDFFFSGRARKNFLANLELSGSKDKVEIREGLTEDVLPLLARGSYDLIYVDGSHAAEDVLFDAVTSWKLLKDGGVIIFDDYGMLREQSAENRPLEAIDAFVTTHRNVIEVLHHEYALVIKKLPRMACVYKRWCTRVNNHMYNWDSKVLVDERTGEPVEVSAAERVVLESLLPLRRIGAPQELFYEEDIAPLTELPGYARVIELLAPRIERFGETARVENSP